MNPQHLEALAPGFVALGVAAALTPLLSRQHNLARTFMAAVSLVLLFRYFLWRVTETVPDPSLTLDFAVGAVFLFAEASWLAAGALTMIFLSRTRERSSEVEANKRWLASRPPPLVDIFICTYNEEETILERTMIGATGLDYPRLRVWVLDDGRRPWLRELSARLGCFYLTRPDNRHAKAGNINHALAHVAALPDRPDFISILDADFVPLPNFLSRSLCLFRDPGVGIVQTPQHFINPDPIQSNLAAAHVLPDEQRFFFDVVLASKDAWGAAFCCGTSSIIRVEPLLAIGGFPTDSVTEDYLLTLRMKEAGYSTSYLNEPLTLGLAPEGLKEYITQRARWCLGFMQIVRGRSGPLSCVSRLDFIDRLSLVDSFLGWVAVYSAKMLGLIVPSLYLLFGVRAVQANLGDLLSYFLPYFIWHIATMAWISGGRSMAIMSDVAQFIAAPAVLKAAFVGLSKPRGHKFKVTAKGGDRSRRFVEWPLLKLYGSILLLTLAGIVNAFLINVRGETIVFGDLALAWSWYNAVVLVVVCFVCIEQPRRRKAERFPAHGVMDVAFRGQTRQHRMADISVSGARLIGAPPGGPGTRVAVTLGGHKVEATIIRVLDAGFAVRFEDALAARVAMVRSFYAGDYVRAVKDVAALGVGRAVAARIFG
jgi:cellulose synthase (UDP-forming)